MNYRNILIISTQPINDKCDISYFSNHFSVELPTEKRVRRWGISLENLMTDPLGKILKDLKLMNNCITDIQFTMNNFSIP